MKKIKSVIKKRNVIICAMWLFACMFILDACLNYKGIGELQSKATTETAIEVNYSSGTLESTLTTLSKDVGVEELNLKIIGTEEMTATDFEYLKSKLSATGASGLYLDLSAKSCTGNKIPEKAFQNAKALKEITLPNNITEIGPDAFSFCTGLTGNLEIPASVEKIGKTAFSRCTGLTGNLEIPNTVTDLGAGAFEGCTGFNGSLAISNGITTIESSTFSGCSNLTGALSIPSNISEIKTHAFAGCSKLSGDLIIPNNIGTIGTYAFAGCIGFKGGLTISSNMTEIDEYVFRGCSGLSGDLVIPDGILTIGEQAFSGCRGFEGRLTISNNATLIGTCAFMECTGFTGDLVIPGSVDVIEVNAFQKCSGFNGSLTISNGVENIGMGAFDGCSKFKGNLKIPNTVTALGSESFKGCLGFNGKLTIPNQLTILENSTFYGCTGLTGKLAIFNDQTGAWEIPTGAIGGLEIPSSVTIIKNDVFYNCINLEGGLTLSNNLTEIGESAFYRCKKLSGTLSIPSGVTQIKKNTFEECIGFTGDLIIPDTVTTLGQSAFENCTGFTGNLDISDEIKTIEQTTFKNCTGFTGTLTLPSKLEVIDNNSFQNCSGFTGELVIPSMVTTIDSYAFQNCSGFSGDLTLPSSLITVKDRAFDACSGINGDITLPNNDSATFGDYAFNVNNGLEPNYRFIINPSANNGEVSMNWTSNLTTKRRLIFGKDENSEFKGKITFAVSFNDHEFHWVPIGTTLDLTATNLNVDKDAVFNPRDRITAECYDKFVETDMTNTTMTVTPAIDTSVVGVQRVTIEVNYCDLINTITVDVNVVGDDGDTGTGGGTGPVTTTLGGIVTIIGTPECTETLTANTTKVTGNDGVLEYQWIRKDKTGNEEEITSATNNTYVVTDNDIEHKIIVKVTSDTNPGTVTSNPTTEVPKKPGEAITINMKSEYDTINKKYIVTIEPEEVGVDVTDCEYKFDNETTWRDTNTKTVTTDNTLVTGHIRRKVTDTNEAGPEDTGTVTTGNNILYNKPFGGTVTITGTPKCDEELTADTTKITGNTASDGTPGTLSYKWIRKDKNGNNEEITSATSSTYTVTEDDIEHKIIVEVTTDVKTGTVTSNPTTEVPKKPGEAITINMKSEYDTANKKYLVTIEPGLAGVDITDCEYKFDNETTWRDTNTKTVTTDNTLVTGHIRRKVTATHEAGPEDTGTVTTGTTIKVQDIVVKILDDILFRQSEGNNETYVQGKIVKAINNNEELDRLRVKVTDSDVAISNFVAAIKGTVSDKEGTEGTFDADVAIVPSTNTKVLIENRVIVPIKMGKIEGVVKDDNGKALNGATVELWTMAATAKQEGTTNADADGNFEFSNIDQGVYTLIAKYDTIESVENQVVGGSTETRTNTSMAIVDSESISHNIQIMLGKKDTKLVVGGADVPPIAVNNLHSMFDGKEDKNVVTEITLESERVSEPADKEQITEKLQGYYKVAMYLDLNLKKKVGTEEAEKIQPPNGEKVTVAITLPDEMKDKGRYIVMRVHDGAIASLPSQVNKMFGVLSFEADKFSTYALVYSESSSKYKLTVVDENGNVISTSMHYPGDIANINATTTSGKTFKKWFGDDITLFGDTNSKNTTYTMGNMDTVIRYTCSSNGNTSTSKPSTGTETDKDKDKETSTSITVVTKDDKKDKPYMEGYKDGTFKPNGYLRRDEVAAIFARIDPRYDENVKYKMTMPDPTEWAYNYIGFCLENHIMIGCFDGTFQSERYITKSEFAAVLTRSQKLPRGTNSRFPDSKGRWFEPHVTALEKVGIKGRPDGNFGAYELITRAEAARLVNLACKRYMTDAEVAKYNNRYTDVSDNTWYYKDVINATR